MVLHQALIGGATGAVGSGLLALPGGALLGGAINGIRYNHKNRKIKDPDQKHDVRKAIIRGARKGATVTGFLGAVGGGLQGANMGYHGDY